ncbi:MAG: glycoside hydrolase family 15 protein [Actinobacteria bacterium]|nr:glycoside hydrolase family 15 protein [Actinomycetota bacterium]
MDRRRRDNGWLPIGEYAAIGDGRTVALVGSDGGVDWLCLPDLDSPSVFARLLDRERGGAFELAPIGPYSVERRYLPDTNVLETTYRTGGGTARVTDALTLPLSGLAPTRELVRRVDGLAGRVAFAWTIAPRFGYGGNAPKIERRGSIPLVTSGADALAVVSWDAGEPHSDAGQVHGRFEIESGRSALIVLADAHREAVVVPARDEVERRLDESIRFWRKWAGARSYDGPWREQVVRSALALKLLVFSPTGAIAGAATTSLPEAIGGDRNYDYRYSWIRDSAFTMNALVELGCSREAQSFFWWLMHASQRTHPELLVLYRLDGGEEAHEQELPLEGYRASTPVRVGNAAAGQLQLDAYGDLLDAASIYARHGLDRDLGGRLAGIADLVCEIWTEKDSGIWEVRDDTRHFTEGKMKCAIALERACTLADRGLVPREHRSRWHAEAAKIREFVETRCWSDEVGSYVRAADGDELDASTLLAGQNRYSAAGDARLAATIEAVRTELGSGPFLYRYTGQREEEGAFVACSFWLVSALARVGRVDEAAELMDELLTHTNDVGLFSEEIDPASGAFLGNFPQGLSHLGVVNAAFAIEEARR